MVSRTPRILIAAASGDGGKTLLSLGIAGAFERRGKRVGAFKKGPDYIDAAWLGMASGAPATNLDTYLMKPETIRNLFGRRCLSADVAVIEGNRGLYDGFDARGSHSSAELAKLLGAPVVLVLNATKATRTLAAVALGMKTLDPDVPLAGVVLNRIAGKRHASVATQAIEESCGIPVLGAIPKLRDPERIPGRHLGLLPVDEHSRAEEACAYAAGVIEDYVDLERLERIAASASPVEFEEEPPKAIFDNRVRVGVLSDGAFSFYYPENMEALEKAGADVIRIHSLRERNLPDIHALYIGGGFPETHAEELAENVGLRQAIANASADGLPVYAECGGLMFLSRSLIWNGRTYPMCGALPVDVELHAKPKGHGYVEMLVENENPFFEVGTGLRGHEFHYSSLREDGRTEIGSVCRMNRGVGIGGGRDGLNVGNTVAFYSHIHASGCPEWAEGIVKAARYRREQVNKNNTPDGRGARFADPS